MSKRDTEAAIADFASAISEIIPADGQSLKSDIKGGAVSKIRKTLNSSAPTGPCSGPWKV
jgi:hypothetical protein